MLCSDCSNIDFDKAAKKMSREEFLQTPEADRVQFRSSHHTGYGALLRAASDGCELCKAFSVLALNPKDIKGNSQLHLTTKKVGDGLGLPLRDGESEYIADLGVYTLGENSLFTGLHFVLRADSSACFDRARKWLQDCLKEHHECQQQKSLPLPTRVIDVGPVDGSIGPRLHLSKGESGIWVALSHRWGNQKILTTTTANIDDHVKALPFASLSKTFQDAVLVTRKLGFQYLWIDSLCIIQDSENDWIQESANMGNIYKNSTITIAASHPRSGEEGIFANRTSIRWHGLLEKHIKVPYHRDSTGETDSIYCREPMQPFDDIIDMKYFNLLQRRGWILQETTLSPRTIHWTQEQLIWHCQTCVRVEANRNPIYAGRYAYNWVNTKTFLQQKSDVEWSNNSSTDSPSTHSASIYTLWLGVVIDFCGRQLTYRDDTFPALSGLANEMQKITNDLYCAGIWKSDIHRGLVWSYNAPLTEPEMFLAPSWSWAAKPSAANDGMDPYFFMQNVKQVKEEPGVNMEVVQFHVVPKTADPFGKLRDGRLTVRAWSRSPGFLRTTSSSPSEDGSEEIEGRDSRDELQFQEIDVSESLMYHEAMASESMLNHVDETSSIRYSLDNEIHLNDFLEQNTLRGSFLALAVAEFQNTEAGGHRFQSGTTSGLLLRATLEHPDTYIRIGLIEVSTEVSRQEPGS